MPIYSEVSVTVTGKFSRNYRSRGAEFHVSAAMETGEDLDTVLDEITNNLVSRVIDLVGTAAESQPEIRSTVTHAAGVETQHTEPYPGRPPVKVVDGGKSQQPAAAATQPKASAEQPPKTADANREAPAQEARKPEAPPKQAEPKPFAPVQPASPTNGRSATAQTAPKTPDAMKQDDPSATPTCEVCKCRISTSRKTLSEHKNGRLLCLTCETNAPSPEAQPEPPKLIGAPILATPPTCPFCAGSGMDGRKPCTCAAGQTILSRQASTPPTGKDAAYA